MGNNNDGKRVVTNPNGGNINTFLKEIEDSKKGIEYAGNSDAKLLAKAYEEYAKDGINKSERDKIEKLDDVLKDADIVLSKNGDSATLVQEDGKSFHLKSNKQRSK